MRTITNLLLLLAARNVQSLLDFITRLDTTIDGFIAKRDAEIAATDDALADLRSKRAGIFAAKAAASRLQAGVRNLTA